MKKTEWLFLGNKILYSPLEALYTLLIFILSIELHASLLQLTILACTKHVVALFAFHISSFLAVRPHIIRPFLIVSTLISALPCFLFPYIENPWFFIASYAAFMTAQRASFPIWNEVLKNDIGLQRIGRVVATGNAINFSMIMCIPLIVSGWMDVNPIIWKGVFVAFACVHLINTVLLLTLTVKPYTKVVAAHGSFLKHWEKGWVLLKANPDFAKYQVLFFLGGVGLIMIQPILPIYFKETLHISYTQLTLAFSLCRGLAFVSSSPLWVRWVSLYRMNGVMNLMSCCFIACLLAATSNLQWLFLGYLLFGAVQAGCELSWNVSGPYFAQENESISYSSVNLALAGIRGCICPIVGQLIFLFSNVTGVFIAAGILCGLSLLYAIRLDSTKDVKLVEAKV